MTRGMRRSSFRCRRRRHRADIELSMLRADGIAKFYGDTRALDGVNFEVRAGEVHAIVGQNGAGKSTLMGLLAGRMKPDRGQLYLDGAAVRMESPLRAIEL